MPNFEQKMDIIALKMKAALSLKPIATLDNIKHNIRVLWKVRHLEPNHYNTWIKSLITIHRLREKR